VEDLISSFCFSLSLLRILQGPIGSMHYFRGSIEQCHVAMPDKIKNFANFAF
jgi:hypothetical protein